MDRNDCLYGWSHVVPFDVGRPLIGSYYLICWDCPSLQSKGSFDTTWQLQTWAHGVWLRPLPRLCHRRENRHVVQTAPRP